MGTMTFGSQCAKDESFKILDEAQGAGIDFLDLAEIYPVPPNSDLAGITEEWVGEWVSSRSRDSFIIATKVGGPAHGWFNPPVRGGKAAIDRRHIRQALEGSLRRLKTDYIDLYQVHWPDHGMRALDTLEVLNDFVREGKVRVIGCSNETSYGLMKSLWASEEAGYRRYDTIQNNFSFNNRRFEDELAECCLREEVSLLPYSPLAAGVLSGKYNEGTIPAGSRFDDYLKKAGPRQKAMAQRFVNERSIESTKRFMQVAEKYGYHPVTAAVAWSKQHDFVASTIVGATSLKQMKPILRAAGEVLSKEMLHELDQISEQIPYPMG